MKYKSIAVVVITALLCMILGSSIACTTPATEYVLDISSTEGGSVTEPGEAVKFISLITPSPSCS